MALQDKYKALIDACKTSSVVNLKVREEAGVLYIDGESNGKVKQKLWDLYGKLDPDYASGDLMLNISAVEGIHEGSKLLVTTNSTNLNIRKGPGTNFDVVGKAARHEVVTLVRKENNQWWVVKTKDGEEGFSFTQYLTPVEA
jgi:Bacterial SH3 domain